MNAVVLGAAGFIGSHLVDRLLADGAHVVGVDNLLTGRLENLASAQNHPRFRFVQADITAPAALTDDALTDHARTDHAPTDIARTDRARTDGAVDLYGRPPRPSRKRSQLVVFHLASPASPVDYAQLSLETMAVNSEGTKHACEFALRWGGRLVFASTSEVYGDPLVHPQTESYWGNVNSHGPRSCYDEAKRFAEAMIYSYARARGLDARIARIFNTYGPRMRPNDGRVVPTLVGQVLRGEPLTVYGDGTQTRSLCYVTDLVDGLVRLGRLDGGGGQVINLGNPDERSVLDIAKLICDITGRPHLFSWQRLPQDDPTRRCPDITRAKALLGWRPAVSLETGLRDTIASFVTPGILVM